MKNLLDLCIKLTGTEYAYIYCYVNNSYVLIRSVHKNDDPNRELICTNFDFDKNEILTNKEAKLLFRSKGFVIREIIVMPVFNEKNEKLGVLFMGSGLAQENKKGKSRNEEKDIKIASRKRRISSPALSLDRILEREKSVFENLSGLEDLLIDFLEVEQYKYMYENKIALGTTEFSRDLLLVNMSHEIRTPLNGIIGYTQLLSKTALSEVQNKYIASMNICCFQLMQIVNDVLDYARLSTSKIELREECFSLRDLSINIQDILGTQLTSKKQTLVFDISTEVSEFIYADKPKIMQILLNLISNAQKFSPEKSEIKVKVETNDEKSVLFEVIDAGIGITKEDQSKLFHVFSQLRNNTVKVGTGLGLAICKKLVELMEGTIWANSSLGHGTSFYFTAKISRCEDMEKRINDNLPLIKGKYVLIVDDNATNRMVLTDLVFEWEMVAVPVASGLEAIRLVMNKRYNFGLALVDIRMPEMDGAELAKLIKEVEPYLPVVAMSSADSFTQNEHFDYRLDKPVHKLKLFNSILNLMTSEMSQEYQLGTRIVSSRLDSPRGEDFKILIAEDISYNLTLLVNILKSLEYKNVDTAYDGKDAIEKLDKAHQKGEPYDILLLDLKMPRVDGYGVLEHVKERKYKTNVAVISASVLEEEKSRCREAGIKFFIPKPIEIKKLKNVLTQISAKKKYRR